MRKTLLFWIVDGLNLQFVDFETFNGNDFLGFDPFGGQKGNLIPRFSKIPNIRIVFPQKFILKGILYFLTSLNQTLSCNSILSFCLWWEFFRDTLNVQS